MNGFSRIIFGVFISSLLFATANAKDLAKLKTIQPEDVHKPFRNRYSHGTLVPANAQWLVTAGQTGINLQGEIVEGIESQADWAMKNLYNVIKAAGMGSKDIVKMKVYYLDSAHLSIIMQARNRYFGSDFRPASTVVIVQGLANPKLLVEVEAIAAKILEK